MTNRIHSINMTSDEFLYGNELFPADPCMPECQSQVVLMLHSTECNSCLVTGPRVEAGHVPRVSHVGVEL